MKDGIHPDYKETVIKCVCGNEIETGSVVEGLTVEICNNVYKMIDEVSRSPAHPAGSGCRQTHRNAQVFLANGAQCHVHVGDARL